MASSRLAPLVFSPPFWLSPPFWNTSRRESSAPEAGVHSSLVLATLTEMGKPHPGGGLVLSFDPVTFSYLVLLVVKPTRWSRPTHVLITQLNTHS